MGGRLLVTGYGAGAVSALRALVDDAKGADPLAPVDVVVPSAFAGMTVRRALAGHGGTVTVRSSSLPQLAERLSARAMALAGTPLLDAPTRTAALAAAAAGAGGSLRAVAASPRTAGLVQQVLTELDDAGVAADDVAALSPLGQHGQHGRARERVRDLADLRTAYRHHLGDAVDGADVLRAAAAAIRDGGSPPTHVVLFAPRRATAAERELLGALADAGRLSAVLCVTGEAEADVDVEALARALRDAGLAPGSAPGAAPAPGRAVPELVVAPDADEEVRLAVRRVVAHLAGGGQPHRVAVTYRAHAPYVRLLAEHLGAAGLPHHVPPTRRLADSTAGRTLTGLLELGRRDLPRSELVRWLSAAPVLDAEGAPVPARWWDRISRAAGVSTGLSTWRSRLQRYATDAERREQHRQECEQAEALLAFVDEVATTTAHITTSTSWPEAARALEAALVRFLGERRHVDRWGRGLDAQHARGVRAEQDAHDAVLVAVRSLAERATSAPALAGDDRADVIADALVRALDASLPSGTVLGRGVHVVPTRAVPGADLDLLVVVGAAEGVMPPRQREHVLLRDAERTALSPDLRSLADRRRDERHDHLAALASARTVVVSHPRADSRSQRGLHASPWFTAEASTATTTTATTTHSSFVSALRDATTHLSLSELDVATALGRGPAALAAADPRYARGVEAVDARRGGAFGPWVGDVGELPPSLRERADGALSATSLQTYATCPHRFWLERVLRVHHHDDPADRDSINPLDRGTLLHTVLEAVMQSAVDGRRSPDAAWTPAEVARAREVLDAEAADLERQGRTGRPLLWRWELTGLHRSLVAVLAADSRLRAALGSRPVAVESTFGRDGDAPLVLDLPRSGPVPFAGSIDRVDELDDGGLLVLDYKSGGDSRYGAFPVVDAKGGDGAGPVDLVDRGKKLQLVLYALAARQKHADPDTEVEARYWFVEKGTSRGASIGPGHERRLLDVVDVAVSGIRGGVYPARPGAEGYYGWESCGYCHFERLCSVERGTTWDRLKGDARVAEFTALAEEEL